MNELPELHIYRERLVEQYADAIITGIEVLNEKVFQVSKEQLESEVVGKMVWFVERRGKYLLFHLDNGKRLLLHLGQGASLYQGSEEDQPARTAQLKLYFGTRILYAAGLRSNEVQLLSVKEVEEQLRGQGPDPFDKRLTLERFVQRFAKKRGALKTAMMDQNVISGIGTVYSDEICFAAAVRPDAKIPVIEPETWERLYNAMHNVLKEAISYGGAAEAPFTEGDAVTGGFAKHLRVYNREGQLCEQTGEVIEKIEVSGRKAFISPGYQKHQ